MLTHFEFETLYWLSERRTDVANGFIYYGTADFFTVEDLRAVEKLEDLGFLEFLYNVDSKFYHGFREYAHLLTPLGQVALMYPQAVIESAH